MHNPLFVHTSALTWICVPSPCRSRTHEKKKYYDNISNVLLIQRKNEKRSGGGNYKKKKEAKFAGHHQIPILFASTFIIVMIFISSSHHRLKSQVLLQNKKKKNKQNILLPSQLPTNSRRSASVAAFWGAAAFASRRIAAAPLLPACMRKTTCELCKGGTIWLLCIDRQSSISPFYSRYNSTIIWSHDLLGLLCVIRFRANWQRPEPERIEMVFLCLYTMRMQRSGAEDVTATGYYQQQQQSCGRRRKEFRFHFSSLPPWWI